MTVNELKNILEKFPKDEVIHVLLPGAYFGTDTGVIFDEVAYITGTKNVRSGVYIKLD